ncbi:MAG: hypothetical protein P8H43_00660 [Crocinitomicaceae bacterium]|jgi:hypothetical protein|nr:hypothetical protein [Crocinitomicaceae bacterium]MDG1741071.1 hypothetical protein [Crocinitomicaceae bacterium]
MKHLNQLPHNLASENLDHYFELGNEASANGQHQQSLEWFFSGRQKAKELNNKEKERVFSALIAIAM